MAYEKAAEKTVDDIKKDIQFLEKAVIELKVLYEQYFMKILKREPFKLRMDVERTIRDYAQEPIQNTTLKFKYNTLVARYSSFKQYWNRTLKQIDAGTYVRKGEGGGAGALKKPMESTLERPKPSGNSGGAGKPTADSRDSYDTFIKARTECGESTKGVTREAFKASIQNQEKKMAEKYGTTNLETKVFVKDGKTIVSVKPKN